MSKSASHDADDPHPYTEAAHRLHEEEKEQRRLRTRGYELGQTWVTLHAPLHRIQLLVEQIDWLGKYHVHKRCESIVRDCCEGTTLHQQFPSNCGWNRVFFLGFIDGALYAWKIVQTRVPQIPRPPL